MPELAPPPRTFQRTFYRPGENCPFDLWELSGQVPVGHGQTRHGWVVVACLGYSRCGAGALVFIRQAHDILRGVAECPWRLGGLPRRTLDLGLPATDSPHSDEKGRNVARPSGEQTVGCLAA